jgi:hypothetical protein
VDKPAAVVCEEGLRERGALLEPRVREAALGLARGAG